MYVHIIEVYIAGISFPNESSCIQVVLLDYVRCYVVVVTVLFYCFVTASEPTSDESSLWD